MSQCAPLLAPSKKGLPRRFILTKKRIYLDPQLKGKLLICFENCQGVPYSHTQGRNRMMNIFIIVNITPKCKRRIYASPLQKGLLSPFSLARNRIYLGSNVTEELTDICFESYRGYPYSHISRVGRGW